jgi:hypothetical protein
VVDDHFIRWAVHRDRSDAVDRDLDTLGKPYHLGSPSYLDGW